MAVETTVEEPLLGLRPTLIIASVLAVLGGISLYAATDRSDFPDIAVAPLVPTAMGLVGVFLGAGLGLLLADVRKTTTTKTPTEGLTADLPTEALKLLKDLTPGKALLVLAVVLFSVVLVSVEPAAPTSTGQQSAGAP